MSSSKSAVVAARRGVHRTNVELPTAIWKQLQAALKIRAARIKHQHGIDVAPTFTSWVKSKAEETIAAFK